MVPIIMIFRAWQIYNAILEDKVLTPVACGYCFICLQLPVHPLVQSYGMVSDNVGVGSVN